MQSRTEIARQLAKDADQIDQIESASFTEGSEGMISVEISRPLSIERLNRLLPNGWRASAVLSNFGSPNISVRRE